MKLIKKNLKTLILITLILILISITTVNAKNVDNNTDLYDSNNINNNKAILIKDNHQMETKKNPSQELTYNITNAHNGDSIKINPGTYKIHNITINKNISIQGNGNPRDVILDGEQLSTIFFIKNINVTVHFSNLTFINGKTDNFGGAISINTGNVYVNNCIFINNTALSDTNAGAISNYGDEKNRAYLFVNDSLFLNNHADHDGGAVTTCYADSDIYNSVFVNNSAHRDGGAIRVSVFGYGNVEDCIFIYNHADEWGGAYYSWAGTSTINRCIFLNNTAGTNGGAVMVSGNLNLTNSIIVNNTADETGGSFYIQQPMFDAVTVMKVDNNIITNNNAPLGKEIFLSWNDVNHLFPKFNNNNWGDEDSSNPSIIDPNNLSNRIHPTIVNHNYDLLYELNFGLLNIYSDIILNNHYPKFSEYFTKPLKNDNHTTHNTSSLKFNNQTHNSELIDSSKNNTNNDILNKTTTTNNQNDNFNKTTTTNKKGNINSKKEFNSASSYGKNDKIVEVFKDTKKSVKSLKSFDTDYIIGLFIIFLVWLFGFLKRKDIFD